MIVMCANNSGIEFGRICGMFGGSVGHLLTPGGQKGPYSWLPYALDNGAFIAYKNGTQFDELKFWKLCDWAKNSGIRPLWVLVPDVVANPVETIKKWDKYHKECSRYGWPLAFAAQDGHKPEDIPKQAEVVFIGGTTTWKRASIGLFCSAFPRVHVGRINTYKWLSVCHQMGVESVDGSGFFRGDRNQLEGLISFLEEKHGTNRHFVQENCFAKKRNQKADMHGTCASRP